MGHNYSPEARKSFKSRHAKNIAKGPTSAAYWANKCLWAGKGGSKKSPPKVRKWLEEPEVKLSGRVYKAVKDKETVELIKERD